MLGEVESSIRGCKWNTSFQLFSSYINHVMDVQMLWKLKREIILFAELVPEFVNSEASPSKFSPVSR